MANKEVIEESERIFQKIMMWAFDEEGNYDGNIDMSMSVVSEDSEGSKEKSTKDGFIEYINTVTYMHKDNIPVLKVINNRMDWKPGNSEENKVITNDDELENYIKWAFEMSRSTLNSLKLVKFPLRGYEWVYLVFDDRCKYLAVLITYSRHQFLWRQKLQNWIHRKNWNTKRRVKIWREGTQAKWGRESAGRDYSTCTRGPTSNNLIYRRQDVLDWEQKVS